MHRSVFYLHIELQFSIFRFLNIPKSYYNKTFVLSSDIFYNEMENVNDLWRGMGVLAVEMEAAALYMNAAKAGKKALCLLTISDHLYTGERLSAEKRQLGFNKMMEIALELA